MKKLITICVVMALAFSLVLTGCESKKDDDKPTPTPSEQVSPTPSETPDETPEESPNEPDETPELTPPDDGNEEPAEPPKLEGSAGELLKGILAAADAELPMSFETALTAESATGVGLTAEEFEEYVEEGQVSTAAINVSAHEVILLKCKDADAAIAVKALVASGYDSGKWICVRPDKSVAVEADVYVLLIASTSANVESLLEVFETTAGDKIGEVNEFFSHAG